ncbi:MAG: RecQ family ATP-dependent DNA helicase [Verrucomicrobia bacterium]|jgi:ATP-dependent DNA helicase RecQ|nr:RecQ family ATP-dependent DNA helicase [Verrucomicrobiota bacterium]
MHNAKTSYPDLTLSGVLQNIFGFNAFRADQEEIVQAILARQDCFVVMPTGGGKSLCYQLPAHMMDGTCVVISPLISLMKDQVDAAIATGLQAAFLNSSLTASMKRKVETQLADGELDLIYVSPERFAMPAFISSLKRVRLSFVAIDEAHCISEWGHDFRPDYLNLSTIVKAFPDVPVTAFTATATHRVQEDIVVKLGLRSPHMVRASFNRPNLFYKVAPKQNVSAQILRFVGTHAGDPGIIYRTTRKSVEQTAAMLGKHGIRALPYHAGLDDATRVRNQDAFNRDEVDVIVATVAFGMGIDKSNVRYVLHGDLPKNMESYYQETGRSGRDGEPAYCQLLFGYGDIPKIRFFIDQITDMTEKKHAIKCLNDMVHYATVHACRRKQLLNYFGEEWPTLKDEGGNLKPEEPGVQPRSAAAPSLPAAPCCDICSGEVESIEATRDAQICMSAIGRTDERFGINHIIAVVIGDDTDRIKQLGHDRIKTFGIGKDKNRNHWRLIMDNLLAKGLIGQSDGDYPTLTLLPAGREVLFEGRKVHVMKPRKTTKRKRGKRDEKTGSDESYDKSLFEQLRELRKAIAAHQGVPPYVVFSDRTLHEMARTYPGTEDALLGISGIGETKLERYGDRFLEAIRTYRAANPDKKPPT